LLLVGPLLAQADAKPPDPMQLVNQAEALIKAKEIEDGILRLWSALDVLAVGPGGPIADATTLSALFLLKTHDANDAERRLTFGAVAKQQLELAAAYRTKKWFDVAATRVAVASAYDKNQAQKEAALLAAARPEESAVPTTKPTPAAPVRPCPLLQRENTYYVAGPWQESGVLLECAADVGAKFDWITTASHANHEIVVEFAAAKPTERHHLILSVGQDVATTTNTIDGYRLACHFDPKNKKYSLQIYATTAGKLRDFGHLFVDSVADPDGFRRLALRVSGRRLRAQLGNSAPLDLDVGEEVQGLVGIGQGLADTSSGLVRFRNLRIDPLPSDAPSDDELRQQALVAKQNAISAAVETARALLGKKQFEPASLRLRDALNDIDVLPAGVLRDNLKKTIEPMLSQADPLWAKRKKAAETAALGLASLADKYAAAQMPRAALELLRRASMFDRDGMATRLFTATVAVDTWNAQQVSQRAAELAPPADDGKLLTELFGSGARLDSRTPAFTFANGVARLADIPPEKVSVQCMKSGSAEVKKAAVHVHLSPDTYAGLAFDMAGPHDYGLAILTRDGKALQLTVYRFATDKWTRLASRPLSIDAWRLDAWHRITVETTPAGLAVSALGQTLTVPRSVLGIANGRFGLAAGNQGKGVRSVELRAFALPQ
jgi:hypothetical protein